MNSSTPHALVVGLGIAGMSAANALVDDGWTVTVVERSTERRRGGYFIGLFPRGAEAARTLGVHEAIGNRTPNGIVTWELDAHGRRSRGTSFSDQPGEPASLLRGDVENALWQSLDGRAEIRFNTTPTAIAQNRRGTRVTLLDTKTRVTTREAFDLVVGADGVRSTVRRLAFGPHEKFLKPFDAMICAFQLQRPLPGLQQHEGAVVAQSRKAFWVFPFADTSPAVLFTYRTEDTREERRKPAVEVLRRRYADMPNSELIEDALQQLEEAPHALFDSVEFVKMSRWYTGHTVLVGDAAWCLTLYSGLGATTGLLGGIRLAEALAKHADDIPRALRSYDRKLRGYMTVQRFIGRLKSQLFVPSSPARARTRARALRALGKRADKNDRSTRQ